MRAPAASNDVGKDVAFPIRDGLFVPFPRTPTRLLRRPFQTLPQKTANMVMMQRDAETSSYEIGNALSGPQLVGPTVSLGAFKEHLLQLLLLRDRQARRWTEVRSSGKAVVGLIERS